MTDIIKLTLSLTLIACAAALLIAITNSKTKDRIADQQSQTQDEALARIMPAGASITENTFFNVKSGDTLSYWIGCGSEDTTYAFKVATRGYSSTLTCLVATNKAGIIAGLTIMDQSETPGLGSRVQEKLSKKYLWNGLFGPKEDTAPWFTEQFKSVSLVKPITIEKSQGEWHQLTDAAKKILQEKNAVTAITGSTISTRAVTSGLTTTALEYLKEVQGL